MKSHKIKEIGLALKNEFKKEIKNQEIDIEIDYIKTPKNIGIYFLGVMSNNLFLRVFNVLSKFPVEKDSIRVYILNDLIYID